MRVPRTLRGRPSPPLARRLSQALVAGVALTLATTVLTTGSLAQASTGTLREAAAPADALGAGRPATVAPQLTANTPAKCNTARPKGFARCMSVIRTPASHNIVAEAAGPPASALGPADIESAYKLTATAGGGQTVAIVDAFGDSRAEADLAVFRAQYGLPPCTTANGCFRKTDQTGGTSYPPDDLSNGWPLETSLDLDAVSAACPACNILLVEGNSDSIDDLGTAADEAVSLGAKYVSNSYGLASEDPSETSLDHYYDHPGVAVAASSGDVGNVVSWPSSSPKVLSVGGTLLTKDSAASRGWDESAWSSGGSGCSTVEPQPDFQLNVTTGCSNRATADIAADADPASGLATYDTMDQGGWLQVGGTSLSSPLVTAMYAMAGTPVASTYPVSYPYHDPNAAKDLFDITSGSDGSCGNLLCDAGPGWDGPTGLGSPDGVAALTSGPHGDITGQVTDAATGKPVSGAAVTASPGGYATRTDTSGDYDLGLPAGSYDLTVTMYAYKTAAQSGVQVVAGQSATQNFALTGVPSQTVSGTVTDGSGHGWPLYAQITIDGYPGGPVYTDPYTGKYSVKLAGQATYTVHVTAAAPAIYHPDSGYQQLDTTLTLGSGDTTRDLSLKVDPAACDAPGYGVTGLSEPFSGWTGGTAQHGWSITGTKSGWRFDNPGNRPALNWWANNVYEEAGGDSFAVADSGAEGPMDTTLTSPSVNLTGQAQPHLTLASGYYGTVGQHADISLSTDGGKRWTVIWSQTQGDAVGPLDIPVPQAAGQADVKVRFHYASGHGGWWWAIDEIGLGGSSPGCVPLPGGLLAGQTADKTGTALTGVAITTSADPAVTGVSAATVDPDLPAGFYELFAPAGSQTFTAAAAGYTTATASVTIAASQVTRHDWALAQAGG